MSILGFFEHTISNAKRAYAYCLDAQRPRYKSIKTKAMLEAANELTPQERINWRHISCVYLVNSGKWREYASKQNTL